MHDRRHRRLPRVTHGALFLLLALSVSGGCSDEAPSASGEVTREERPDGVVVVRHGALPDEPTHRLEADLVLGELEGEPWEMFGQIRSVDAGSDGALYILDFQARAIRVFDADGTYLRTLGGPGEGPGEISQANGVLKEPGGLLWVNDHGKMRILGLRPDGTEVLRAPFPVMGFGFSWHGERDREGRFWGSRGEPVGGAPAGPPEPGVNESTSRIWFHAVHPETEARDSVYVGERSGRSFVTLTAGGGWSVRSIPFAPLSTTLVDPDGGFWATHGAEWRVVRLDARGDTTLILEAAIPREPVTAEDRDPLVRGWLEDGAMEEPAVRELAGAMPDRKPALMRIFLDDQARLWVQRAVFGPEASPRWDVFESDGTLVASVEPTFRPDLAGVVPRVRHGHAYFVGRGDEGHPVVIRAPITF
jgi:hypothetical protein